MKNPKTNWKNRIVGYATIPVDQIKKNEKNWRIHPEFQAQSLAAVLDEVGIIQNVLVNRTTGNLIDGHLRLSLAEKRGEPEIPVTFVELSENEEKLILASLDPLSALAIADDLALHDLVGSIETQNEQVQIFLENLDWEIQGTTAVSGDILHDKFDSSKFVKIVISVEKLEQIEKALDATGKQSRGDALLVVCEEFLNAKR